MNYRGVGKVSIPLSMLSLDDMVGNAMLHIETFSFIFCVNVPAEQYRLKFNIA